VSSRRTLILIAALVIGALAAVVVWNYVNGADDRAQKNAAQVPVLVVKTDIPRGLTGAEAIDNGYIAEDDIPTKFKPNTAVNDATSIRTFVAVTDIPANSVLVAGMFVSPEEANVGNAELLKDGRVAITVAVDDVHGVAGLVVPGDFVNVYLRPNFEGCLEASGPETQPGVINFIDPATVPIGVPYICHPARLLYQKVQVLFVDKTTIAQPGQTPTTNADGTETEVPQIKTGIITFAVPPAAAQFLASIELDQLYLALVAPDYVPVPLPPIDVFATTLPGEDGNQLTPYGPNGLQGD